MSKSQSLDDRRKRNTGESDRFHEAWAIVSRNPCISRRELAKEMGLESTHTSQYWIERLVAAGVVELAEPSPGRARADRALRVVVPLALVKRSPVRRRKK